MMFHDDILKFSNSIGKFIEYWGFRRVDGEIWVLIYLSEHPIDAGTLICNLNVSKGMISTSIKTLIEHNLIKEVDHGDNRSKYYCATSDPMNAVFNVLKMREKSLINEISSAYKIMKGPYEGISSRKLKAMGNLVEIGKKFLLKIIKLKDLLA